MKAKPLSMRCDYLVFQVQQVAHFLAVAIEGMGSSGNCRGP